MSAPTLSQRMQSICNNLELYRHFAQAKCDSSLAGYGDASHDSIISMMSGLESSLDVLIDEFRLVKDEIDLKGL